MMISGSARFNDAMAELKRRTGNGDDYKLRDAVIDEVEALQADNARLRAVIKEAEKSGDRPGAYPTCPWCQSEPGDKDRHADCPAFTPEGEVR